MKTAPTETDREAARLFEPAPGMRAWRTTGVGMMSDPGMVIEVDPATAPHGGIRTERGWSWLPVCAIDADDPATVGVMLAQVEAVRPGQAVSIVDRLHSLPGEDERRFAVLVEHDGTQTVATGPTRGAALVAARRVCA